MSALEWRVENRETVRFHEARSGTDAFLSVDEWAHGGVDWRTSVFARGYNVARTGRVGSVEAAKQAAVDALPDVRSALSRAIGPDLAAAIRQAQASVDAAQTAYDQGEWAEPETIARSSLAQLAALIGVAS